MQSPISRKIGFVSLGCPKNLVDSERILTQLRAEGYAFSSDYAQADLIIINTCGFIEDAVNESLDAIGEALEINGRVIVTGCLGKRAEIIRDAYPEVLAIIGPHDYESVMAAVRQHLPMPHNPFIDLLPSQGIKLTPKHYAYLKIAEGCNHHCSFCIIPSLRGRLDSRPLGDIMSEATRLVESGVRELLIVSQDTSAYGADLKYRTDIVNGKPIQTRLKNLAQALGQLPAWTRLHYVYPYPQVDDLIPLMAEGLILPYLDMPLQHGSPAILKAMKRPAATEKILDRIKHWRTVCPELTLRSTFIVGFPGETEADFDQLLEFIQTAQLDRVGCFAYSPVEGATANTLPNPVPEPVKQDRLQRFMEIQAQISRDKLAAQVGREMTVLIDAVEKEAIYARGPGDAPEVDGQIVIEGEWDDIEAGDFMQVQITSYDEHDLYATPI